MSKGFTIKTVTKNSLKLGAQLRIYIRKLDPVQDSGSVCGIFTMLLSVRLSIGEYYEQASREPGWLLLSES